MNTEFVGYIAAVLTTASFIPQAIKIIKTRDTTSISFFMYLLFTSGVGMWLVYGIIHRNLPIMLANVVTTVFASIILAYKIRSMVATSGRRT